MRNVIKDLYSQWKEEYEAPFSGWDFSYLNDRWIYENPPWDYARQARQLVQQSTALLDMGTGGGEFLASLAPLPKYTCATEGWKTNVAVAKAKLETLGARVLEVDESNELPFSDGEFDTVLNRHSAFKSVEVFRVLKPGGTFLTQQVGGNDLQDFAEEFDTNPQYQEFTFATIKKEIEDAGFSVKNAEEWYGKMEFMDVGAIVYFIRAIPWTVPGFNFDKNIHHLEKLQYKLDRGEKLAFTRVRFLFQAEKSF
ncbi:methyltransferase domain-containing protein [Chloroflexota bacterium]